MGDTVEAMKAEAATMQNGTGTWRENDRRLIWCGKPSKGGGIVFRDTRSPTSPGPVISEAQAADLLATEGPWMRPSRFDPR